ncbi:MAG: copper resistance CopC family protein [Actinomycetota bacterium]
MGCAVLPPTGGRSCAQHARLCTRRPDHGTTDDEGDDDDDHQGQVITVPMDRKMLKIALAIVSATVVGAAMVPAYAHTEVSDSSPQDGATVDVAPDEVWVKFGSVPPPGEQPLAIAGGVLDVYDACGSQVSMGETQMNELQNQLTVASGGGKAGRYEIVWTVEATDGDVQSGVIDFIVSSGAACSSVRRVDPAKDVDRGFDVKSVGVEQNDLVTSTQVKLKKPITCKALSSRSDDALQLGFDSNADETDDFTGTFSCRKEDLSFTVAAADDDRDRVVYPASLNRKGNALTVELEAGDLSDGKHLDLYALSSSEARKCSREPAEGKEAPTCIDRAPDLGVLRAF